MVKQSPLGEGQLGQKAFHGVVLSKSLEGATLYEEGFGLSCPKHPL